MEDIYKCMSCGGEHDGYHSLKHYSQDSGGFCRYCGGDYVIGLADLEEEEEEEENGQTI